MISKATVPVIQFGPDNKPFSELFSIKKDINQKSSSKLPFD